MTAQAEQATPVYASSCAGYALAGWTCVIPVPPEAKHPPPGGFTGEPGRDTTPEDLAGWAQARGSHSIALRMPDGIIGIDIDNYVKGGVTKQGAAVVAAAEAETGPLPPTYSSTARGPGQPSRIQFYRVPPGRYAGQLGPDVEIIQRHHRYAVVAPSPHYDIGTLYTWYAPDGSPLTGKVPGPGDMAELPDAWVRRLAAGAAAAGPAPARYEEAMALLARIVIDGEPPCVAIAGTAQAVTADCSAAVPGSRHDAMTRAVYEIVMLGTEGHPGCENALTGLQEAWTQVTAGEGREDEFSGSSGFLVTAARKAAAKYPDAVRGPRQSDPCLAVGATAYAAPAPAPAAGTPEDEIPRPVEPPRTWSPFEAIGTQPFTPVSGLDAPLASEVLARVQPVLRYAPDAGVWVTRGPEKWEARRGDLTKWAVDLVSWMMLKGDPGAPEDSDALRAYKQRVRFTTNASSNSIAAKMAAQVAAGHHPSAIELADLDVDREILWAAGVPYDLRDSAASPAIAVATDPGTPHLHSAGVVPELRETPLWDRLVAAVWPDADLRAWALRVLAIAVTGYSDKALPILLGESDAGKTSIIVLISSVLGSYSHVADARLLSPADRSHASIVYALKGRRLSFIDEAPRTGGLATERLKQLTGGAELTGNRMHENPVTFSPTHTLILTANPEHEPQLNDGAIARRVRLIPCSGSPAEVRAARAAIGTENSPAWRAEAPGVLAKMMAEAARWLADPMSADNAAAPASGRAAVAEIQRSQDLVWQWLAEECEPWENGTRSRDLYMAFTDSCRRMSIHPSALPSETRWGRRLTDLGYPPQNRRDANYRQLRIRPAQGFMPLPSELNGSTGGAAQNGGGSTLHKTVNSATLHQPSTNGKTPGHPTSSTPSVEGVEGYQPIFTHIHTHTRTHAKEGDIQPSTPSTPSTEDVVSAGQDSCGGFDGEPWRVSGPSTPSTADPAGPPGPEPVPDPEPDPESSPKVTKARKAKEPRKLKEAPPRPDPALAGPVHPLPVLVARDPAGGLPLVVPCTVADAVQLAETYLDALCVDCETTGYPPGHADFALRTVQLGGEAVAAGFDPSDPAQAAAITDLITRAAKLHAHSAAADLVPLAAAGLADADEMWAKTEDSVLIAKLADPSLAGSDENELKKLAAALLGEHAVSPPAEKAKNALFKSGRWLMKTTPLTPVTKSGWAQVNPGCETMARYAGSDVLDLAAVLRVLPRPDEAVLAREREFQTMCGRISHQGFRLDPAHITAKIAEHEQGREACRGRVSELCPGITNPSSTTEVPAALHAMGIPLGRTGDGNPSAAKAVLEPLAADAAYEHHELVRTILDYRHHVTTLGLLLEPMRVLCEHGDGRMRPVVYTINADTGRTSCVRPNGQQFCFDSETDILTDRGWLPFPAVTGNERVAQWSEDGTIEFVTPLNVIHNAYDGPMIRIAGEHHEQVVTPNHRVYSKTRDGSLRIEEAASWLKHGARDKIVDRKLIRGGRHAGQRLSDSELLALRRAVAVQADGTLRDDCKFIGLAFTKKRKAERARELGLEVKLSPNFAGGKQIYKAKAYAEDCEPWLVLPDKTFSIPALLGLDAADLQVFLDEIMFWDGDFTRGAAYNQSVTRAAAVDAVELAAILCGHSTCRSVKQVAGRYYACVQVHASADRFASRTSVTQVPSDGMVHCVEVPSGAVVVRHGGKVVVSGNSRRGGIRACVIADDAASSTYGIDMAGISADFSGLEIRVGAGLSGDTDLLAAETSTRCLACGQDPCSPGLCGRDQNGLHWMAALMAFGPDATKEDRYNCKRIIFSKMFGGGPQSGAAQVGIPFESSLAIHRAFERIAPRFAEWDQQMRAYLEAGNRGFQAYSGRVIWLPRGRAHAAGNYAIQGSARELLVDGSLRWHQTRWGKYPILPIHDELFGFVPAAEAEEALQTLVACMAGSLYGVPIEAVGCDAPFLAWPDSS